MPYLQGEKRGVLVAVQPYTFHGMPHYRVAYTFTDGTFPEARTFEAAVAAEQIHADPRPGDAIRLRFLMNILERVDRA